ncbi:MAG: T9SS type A sorting domain-containing protein [Flavobacteriales bacterium]|nr:T9SS type A sorting domain-containing protein [Flavobacteriales bacterium]
MLSFRQLLLAGALTVPVFVLGQPFVDITLVDNGNNQLEVRVRPDADFDESFSSIVFTIRWSAASGADLGAVQQLAPAAQYMPIGKSGGQNDNGPDRYQIFYGVSLTPLQSISASWSAGTEYTLMTIPVLNGSGTFEIINDGWTAANNGDYYVSCNGLERTGVIYNLSTGISISPEAGSFLELLPNPAKDQVRLEFSTIGGGDVTIELMNGAGQVVRTRTMKDVSGTASIVFDLTDLSPGVYPVRLQDGSGTLTRRLIVR